MKEKIHAIVAGALVIIILGCTVGTIRTNAVDTDHYDQQYIKQIEQNYKALIQEELEQEGIHYSGITIMKICQQNGTTNYKIKIYNRKFSYLTIEKMEEIRERLEQIETFTELDTFRKDFLILNS